MLEEEKLTEEITSKIPNLEQILVNLSKEVASLEAQKEQQDNYLQDLIKKYNHLEAENEKV